MQLRQEPTTKQVEATTTVNNDRRRQHVEATTTVNNDRRRQQQVEATATVNNDRPVPSHSARRSSTRESYVDSDQKCLETICTSRCATRRRTTTKWISRAFPGGSNAHKTDIRRSPSVDILEMTFVVSHSYMLLYYVQICTPVAHCRLVRTAPVLPASPNEYGSGYLLELSSCPRPDALAARNSASSRLYRSLDMRFSELLATSAGDTFCGDHCGCVRCGVVAVISDGSA